MFKSKVLSLIRTQKKSIFNIHDPKGIKRLFQLRVGLCPLRRHKIKKHFRDTPSTDVSHCQLSAEATKGSK